MFQVQAFQRERGNNEAGRQEGEAIVVCNHDSILLVFYEVDELHVRSAAIVGELVTKVSAVAVPSITIARKRK